EGPELAVLEAVAAREHEPLTLGEERVERALHARELLAADRLDVRLRRVLVGEEAVQRARARPVVHGLLEADRVALRKEQLGALLVDSDLVREVRRRVLDADALEALHGLAQVAGLLDRAARQPDRAARVVDGPGHLRTHPPPRVRREPDAAIGIEALGRAEEADVALLDQILFVHERTGQLAGLPVRDPPTAHRE